MMRICENGITRDMTAAEIAAWQRSLVGLAPTATDAELAAAQAAQNKAKTALDLKRSAAELLAAYRYQGVNFPLTPEKIAYYRGVAEESASLPAEVFPLQLIGNDGIVPAANATAVIQAYADMQATYLATMKTLGDALAGV